MEAEAVPNQWVTLEKAEQMFGWTRAQIHSKIARHWDRGVQWALIDGRRMINWREVEKFERRAGRPIKAQLPKQTYVYLVAALETRMVKIGITNDLKKRLHSMQSGSPCDLVMLAHFPGSREDEQELHHRFRELRSHGEWFRDTKEIRELFRRRSR